MKASWAIPSVVLVTVLGGCLCNDKLNADGCLDSGGRWNDEKKICEVGEPAIDGSNERQSKILCDNILDVTWRKKDIPQTEECCPPREGWLVRSSSNRSNQFCHEFG